MQINILDRIKVSTQIIVLFIITIFVISGLFYYFGKSRQDQFFKDYLKEHSMMTMKYLSLGIKNSLLNDEISSEAEQNILKMVRSDPNLIFFEIYDLRNGERVLTSYGPDTLEMHDLSLTEKTQKVEERCLYDEYFLMSKDISTGQGNFRLFIAISSKFIAEDKKEQFQELILRTTAVFLIASILGLLIIRRMNKPLARLTDLAHKISDGEIGTRADETKGGREVRELAGTLNMMLGNIEDDRKQIQEKNKVLTQANEDLQKEINERKKAERSLEISRSNIQKVFDAVPFPLVIVDMENSAILSCNEKFNPIFRKEIRKELSFSDLFLDKNDHKDLMDYLKNEKKTTDWETILISKDDNEFHSLISSALIDYNGREAAIFGIIDINDRKHQQEAFKKVIEGTSYTKGEEFLRSLVKNLARVMKVKYAGVMEVIEEEPDRARALAYWSGDHFMEPFEYDIKGTPCEYVVGGEMRLYSENIKELFPDSPDIQNNDVESYWGAPISDSTGKPIGHLVVEDTKPMLRIMQNEFFLKIFAARAGAEIEQKRAQKALMESEERFRLLTENSSDQILEISDDRIIYANKKYWEYIGENNKEAITLDLLQGVHPDDKPILRSRMQIAKENDETFRMVFRHNIGDDNDWRWMELKGNFFDTAKGDRHGVIINRDITETKKAQEAIVESEQMLRMIIDTAPAIIIYVDNENRYKKLNELAAKATGSTQKEMIGKDYREVVPEKMRDFFQEKLKETKEARRIMSYDYSMTVNGETKHLYAAINPHYNNDEFLGFVIIAIDVTQKKIAEEALKENERLLQRVIDTAPLNITYLDNNYKFLMVNEAYCRSMGYSKEELLGNNIGKVLPEYHFANVKNRFKEIISTRETLTFEYDMIINGKKKYFYAAMSPHFSSNGDFLGMVNIGFDITNVREAQEALKISEERFRKLTQSAQDAIIIMNNEGQVTFWNKGAERIFGYTSDEVIDKDVHDLIAPEEYHDQFRLGFAKFKETGTGPVIGEIQELNAKRKDGSVINLELSVASVQVKENWHAIGIARDISERKRMENDLKIAKENAESANKAKSEFLANMSHEIRTPMNAIIGFSELLLERINDSQQRSFAEAISSSGSSLLNIINDILDLSKIEAGRIELEYSTVDPHKIFNEIEKVFSLKVAEKGLRFITEIDEDIPRHLVLDEIRLRQILVNLVGNAVKFTDEGYVKLSIEKGFSDDQKTLDLYVKVEDSGIGIPEKDKEAIFESFRQQSSQSTKKYGGTGLGLAITKRLVEMMGGNIDVESREGEGSVFTVEIKDIKIERELELAHEEDTYFDETVRFKNARILLVDDIPLNRELVKEYLYNRDLIIDEAENGKDAIEKAKEFKPDLILMDMKMPEMDGYQATLILRSDTQFDNTPVIALTASAMKGDEIRIKETGCNAHLIKPVAKNALINELSKFLDHETESDKKQLDLNQKLENLKPDKEKIINISQLIDRLEKEFVPRISKLRDNLIIGMINILIEDLSELAKEHNSIAMQKYTDDLSKMSEDFDLPGIRKVLDYFPVIVAKFKN